MTLEQRKKKVKQKGGSLPRGWDEGGSGGRREMGSLSKARSQVRGARIRQTRKENREKGQKYTLSTVRSLAE